MFIWNRKEVYAGYDLKRFTLIKALLSANCIRYSTRVVNRNSSSIFGGSRERVGTLGEKMDLNSQYYLYVNKVDFDFAISKINRG